MLKKLMLIVLSVLPLQQCANKASQVSPEVPHGHTNSEEELNSNLIPLEDFFKNPEKTAFQISSDGQKVAFLQPWENRLNVHIQSLGSDEIIRLTSATERDIAGYLWLGNNRIGYVQDTGGDENFRLYAIDIDGSNQADLTPFDSVKVRIVDDLEETPEEVLIGMNKRDQRLHDVYRLNVITGEMELIAENPGNISGWQTDHAGKLRLAFTADGVNTSILYRQTEQDSFRVILTTDFRAEVKPLFFTFDNENLYVSSNRNRDKAALYKFDIETATETDLIFEHDEVPVNGAMYSKKRKVLTGVSAYTEKMELYFFDAWRENIQRELENKLPGVEVRLRDLDDSETMALVRTFSDKNRGAYYIYNTETKELNKLADISPWLDPLKMAAMKPIAYKSRDGLTIHGYLTLPKNSPGKNLPVIVNPHGGPWARDYWGFNSQVQFLANRGYAVLQMNFRGSTGYGREFWEIGFKQWGKNMQDDITDGVHWLIDEGIADKDRIGIYGGSYGGYATLAGLAFTPELYACGIDFVGPSNLFTLLDSLPPYWELYRKMMYEMVGDPETDKELIEDISPFFHADRIKAPLFVAQGANDPRVKQAESDQIVEALESKGIDVQYMLKENEGHGFRNEENRMDFYEAMIEFLDKHMN